MNRKQQQQHNIFQALLQEKNKGILLPNAYPALVYSEMLELGHL